MSLKQSSPTAQLLRSSRLFSLPQPLPRPGRDLTAANVGGTTRSSDTATLSHPIYQAIVTPTSSRSRGDWGFKRQFPLRSTTNSSNPTVRVRAVDTIEHITDFESASDHTRTLQKWHETNMPLGQHSRRNAVTRSDNTFRSGFEEAVDNTVKTSEDQQRWKYDGPWLAGMSEGDFIYFVNKTVQDKKVAFTQYLREVIKQKIITQRRMESRAEGESADADVEVTEIDYADQIKLLRNDTSLNSELTRIIRDFLDLPGVIDNSKSAADSAYPGSGAFEQSVMNIIETSEDGPPQTHPSAGLSYLRNRAFLEHHPVLGPLASHAPVEGRILTPRRTLGSTNSSAAIGVGGIVVRDQHKEQRTSNSSDTESIDIDTPGGRKVWYSLLKASIDSKGRIKLEVDRAGEAPRAIAQGLLPQAPARSMRTQRPYNASFENLDRSRTSFRSVLQDNSPAAPKAEPFADDEIFSNSGSNQTPAEALQKLLKNRKNAASTSTR